jgi:hypothetical protein
MIRDASFHGWSPYVPLGSLYIWYIHHCNNESIISISYTILSHIISHIKIQQKDALTQFQDAN